MDESAEHNHANFRLRLRTFSSGYTLIHNSVPSVYSLLQTQQQGEPYAREYLSVSSPIRVLIPSPNLDHVLQMKAAWLAQVFCFNIGNVVRCIHEGKGNPSLLDEFADEEVA